MARRLSLLAVVLLGLLLAAAGLFWPRGNTATVTLLAVPRTAAAAPQMAATLVAVLPSMDVFTKAAAQDPDIRWGDFGQTDAERRTAWKKAVHGAASRTTGILTVSVRHPDAEQAGRIAQAVVEVFTQRGREYLGPDVEVRLLDAPRVR